MSGDWSWSVRVLLVASLAAVPAGIASAAIVVCVDPGHGNGSYTAGGQRGNCTERDANLNVAFRLADLIEQDPTFQGVLTRTDDNAPALQAHEANDLEARVRIANAYSAAYFISIHHDDLPAPADSFTTRFGHTLYQDPYSSECGGQQCPQKPYVPQSARLAGSLANELCWEYMARYRLDCGGAKDMHNYYVLRMNPRPASITEASFIFQSATLKECLPFEPHSADEARGIYFGLAAYVGQNTAARFLDYGAWDQTAYCRTFLEQGSRDLVLRGYASVSDYPGSPIELAVTPAEGGLDLIQAYQVTFAGSYAMYDWLERDRYGFSTSSGPFVAGSRPPGFDTLYAQRTMNVNALVPPEYLRAADSTLVIETQPVDANAADIIVYSTAVALAGPVTSQIKGNRPDLKVRQIIGADASPKTSAV